MMARSRLGWAFGVMGLLSSCADGKIYTGVGPSGRSGPAPLVVSCDNGFAEIPSRRDGSNVEQVCVGDASGLNRAASLRAFSTTVFPLLRAQCAACHSGENARADGAQAPIHADRDPALAHEYALTRVSFRSPKDSPLVTRLALDRHACFGASCKAAADEMLARIEAWAAAVLPSLLPTPRLTPEGTVVSTAEVQQWIKDDRATIAAADLDYVKYVSLHELHNAGVTAEQLDVARVAVSKMLNSSARWAPKIANPVDINGQGLIYRFDSRDYWGYNKGVTKLHFGGSDDDLFFTGGKTDVNGAPITAETMEQKYNFAPTIAADPAFAKLVWRRIGCGNAEGANPNGTLPSNTAGFKGDYVEASQLVYTLSRPDVYNAIMAIPWYATELEDEVGLVKDAGADSYQYLVTRDAATLDSRLFFRARTSTGGFYWKTFNIFTGQMEEANPRNRGRPRFPFWENPLPRFVAGKGGGVTARSLSLIATLWQPSQTDLPTGSALEAQCDPAPNYGGDRFYNCRFYTGSPGLQQHESGVIWNLPNGLQGFALYGGFNQRRVDSFVNVFRDPRRERDVSDTAFREPGFAVEDARLSVGASCIACHADGISRANNNLRDWLDEGRLPTGLGGADAWVNDAAVTSRVRSLYPPTPLMRQAIEEDRRAFLTTMAKIKQAMIVGPDKNVYVEPVAWTFEWAQQHYGYKPTRSN